MENNATYNEPAAASKQIAIAFDKGFSNASTSLGQFINDNIQYDIVQRGYFDIEASGVPSEGYEHHNKSAKHLITTEIIGEVTGKSYLFLSEEEFSQLTASIPGGTSGMGFKEEFLKELDNIISAAVITELANNLQKKMYGSVPVFVGKVNSKIEDAIYDDFNDGDNTLFINSISFTFKSNPAITPLFIWVVNQA